MGKQKGWVQGWGRQSCSEWQEIGQMPAWSSLALQVGVKDEKERMPIKFCEYIHLTSILKHS